jgi:hypothetical protein
VVGKTIRFNPRKYPQYQCTKTSKITSLLPTYILMYVDMYLHTYMHGYLHTYVHGYLHTYVHAFIHTWVSTCMHAYMGMYISMYICMCIHNVHTCTFCMQTQLSKLELRNLSLHTLVHMYIEGLPVKSSAIREVEVVFE